MVSLRKNTSSTPKFLFSKGEIALCFEPDANKAKVLYDSKILDIIPRDNSNRSNNKKIEYSVHFYGWSKNNDRKVSEELLLKDTVSNRKLQRELAQQAADQLKGKRNLKLNKIPNIIKEVITNNVISPLDENENEKFEQTLNVDSMFGEDSSNSNFYTTNSNSTINELEPTNQNNLPNNFQTAVSALTNQTIIKSVNDANLFTVVNNQITNCINQPINDNIELCQQIITNLDEEIKNLLEKDQYRICEEEKLYDLPINIDYNVHKILNEYEQFSLRMLNSSTNQLTNLNCKKSGQCDKKELNQLINQTKTGINLTRSSNRLTNQPSNNQILNNFNSTNSNNSTSSNSSLNCASNGSNKETQISNPPYTNQTILEFTNSIEIYFNTLTERMYIFYSEKEKKQFLKLKQDNNYIKPAHTFGFIHLLRLIILLPDFLSICTIPNKKLKQVLFFIDNFCKYLVDNQTKFISTS